MRAFAEVGDITQETREHSSVDFALVGLSSELSGRLVNFYDWREGLVKGVKDGQLFVSSHDSRNYLQTVHFVEPNKLPQDSTIVAEIQYGDDFHKAKGNPVLVSYTGYTYKQDGGLQVVKYSLTGESSFKVVSEIAIHPDGSRQVEEEVNGKWVKKNFDKDGTIINSN